MHGLAQNFAQGSPTVFEIILEYMLLGCNPSDMLILVEMHLPRLLLHLGLAGRAHLAFHPVAVGPSYRAEEPRIQLGEEADRRASLRRNSVSVEAPVPRLDLGAGQG
jgi:hypothetical protein